MAKSAADRSRVRAGPRRVRAGIVESPALRRIGRVAYA